MERKSIFVYRTIIKTLGLMPSVFRNLTKNELKDIFLIFLNINIINIF